MVGDGAMADWNNDQFAVVQPNYGKRRLRPTVEAWNRLYPDKAMSNRQVPAVTEAQDWGNRPRMNTLLILSNQKLGISSPSLESMGRVGERDLSTPVAVTSPFLFHKSSITNLQGRKHFTTIAACSKQSSRLV